LRGGAGPGGQHAWPGGARVGRPARVVGWGAAGAGRCLTGRPACAAGQGVARVGRGVADRGATRAEPRRSVCGERGAGAQESGESGEERKYGLIRAG
jgi:hypothetical protein